MSVSLTLEHNSKFMGNSHLPHGYLGGLAGLLMDTILHPMDTVRTRIKTNVHESVGLRTQIRTMLQNEGAFSYFRGLTCTLAGSFIANGSYFFIYEKLKYLSNTYKIVPHDVAPFIAAFAGGLFSNTIYLPFIAIRTRMQINAPHYDYSHFFDGIKKVLKHEGFRKLYLGGPVFFMQTALDTSLTFGFYELLHRTLKPFFPTTSRLNLPLSIASSVGAASLAALVVNPLDVVVARMQIMHSSLHGPCSISGMIARIYQHEGLGGFMKGVTGTMSHYSMAALILFPTYETFKEIYQIDTDN